MGELANYSIETDQVVLLAFRDGRRLRVHVSRLSRYLGPRDLEKVRAALKLRRDFIKKHMPKTVLVLAAGGALALLALGGKVVATILNPPQPAPPPGPGHTAIVRSQPLPEPTVAPTLSPTPAVKGAATVAAIPPPSVHRFAKHRHGLAALVKAVPPLVFTKPSPSVLPSPSPSPAATPPPVADNNSPSNNPAPSPSPTPIPNQGEVLGDSTGPQ